MKVVLYSILFILVTWACIAVPHTLVREDFKDRNVTVGPNELQYWDSDRDLVANSSFSFKSSSYFEIRQGDTVKQSVFEKPGLGEEKGLYWIHDLPISGRWSIRGSAEVFSNQEAKATLILTEVGRVADVITAVFWGFIIWAVIMVIIVGIGTGIL